ncbi:hypothetical protein [Enterovibrio norvegicus]|uniref:hypothetical protein n=1 Tax=Enterovibrio norvegicus TaxID=188144 RepID=UPI00352E0437
MTVTKRVFAIALIIVSVLCFYYSGQTKMQEEENLIASEVSPKRVSDDKDNGKDQPVAMNGLVVEEDRHRATKSAIIEESPNVHRSEKYTKTYSTVTCQFLEVYGEQDTFENWKAFSTDSIWLETYSSIDADIGHDLVEFRQQAAAYYLHEITWFDVVGPPHSVFVRMYAKEILKTSEQHSAAGIEHDVGPVLRTAEMRMTEQYGDKIGRIVEALGRKPVVERLFEWGHREIANGLNALQEISSEENLDNPLMMKPLTCDT